MTNDIDTKTPPHDADAELAIIASALVYGRDVMDAMGSLQDGDFFTPAHRSAWQAIAQLAARHAPTDPVSVGAEIAKLSLSGWFAPSWATWAFEAAQKAQVPQLATHYAGIVRQMAVLRRLIDTCTEVAAKCYARQPADEVLSLAREQVSKLEIYGDENEPKRVGELMATTLEEIEKRQRGEGRVVKSSVSTLQHVIGGYKPGQLILVAARPGEGKTALAAVKEALGAARDQGIPTLISSHEMSAQENIERELGQAAKVEVARIISGGLDYSEWKKLQNAGGAMSDIPLFIDDRPLSLAKLCATIRRWHAKEVRGKDAPIGFVVVDYAQLVKVEKSYNAQTREREVSTISRELKLLAKDLQIPIVLVCQLSRAIEERGGLPQLRDLRESGGLEQDADVVIFIHCEAPPEDQRARNQSGPRKLVIGKQRNGKRGIADVNWTAEFMEFTAGSSDEYDGPDTKPTNWQDGRDA